MRLFKYGTLLKHVLLENLTFEYIRGSFCERQRAENTNSIILLWPRPIVLELDYSARLPIDFKQIQRCWVQPIAG